MTTFLFDDDIDTMMADSPHSMTFGGATKQVWFDEYDDRQMDSNGQATGQKVRINVVTYRTNDFPKLKSGDEVAINGKRMRLMERMAEGDGALSKFWVGA